MKLLFPLPILYDGTEYRYLQRDGARFAGYLASKGHCAQKLIVDGGDGFPPPQSPLLMAAPWNQWTSPDFWKDQKADAILLYGGMNPKLEAVASAIKRAGVPVALKMDSANGILPFPRDLWRLLKTGYHAAHQRRGVLPAAIHSLCRQVIRATRKDLPFLRRYLPLFDIVTAESEYAVENTRRWLLGNNLPDVARRTILLGHPVPDAFRFDNASPRKKRQILAVARDWRNPLKGGALLGEALSRVLNNRPDYAAVVAGEASEELVGRLGAGTHDATSRISTLPLQEAEGMMRQYVESSILALASGSEGMPNVVTEALCCGCSIVFPPELKQLAMFSNANCGTMARRRAADSIATSILRECDAWEGGERDPVRISETWSTQFHTSRETERLLSLLGLPCLDTCP